jgi:nitronate monooxygenase
MVLRTRVCDRLGIAVPIVQAPMGGAVGPRLAAAVAEAGGLGMLGLSWTAPEAMREALRETTALTRRPFGVNLVMDTDQTERLGVALDAGVKIISLFWGDPAPYVRACHERGAIVVHTVGSSAEARRSVAAGADVIVAQGWEAGGHVWGEVATLALVPRVVDAVAPVPVIAAGGIADGRGLAAVLALGAEAAWVGTRFLAAEESDAHPRYRERLIAADETSTVHTELFDIGWPNAPHRALRNATVAAWEAAGRPAPGQRPGEGDVVARRSRGEPVLRYDADSPRFDMTGALDEMCLYAGQGVGLLAEVAPARAIIARMIAEAEAALSRLNPT